MIQVKKEAILEACKSLLLGRMEETRTAMISAQESANNEEKSSMGDKYETGRAMSQLERDMNAKQLAILQDEYTKLLKVDISVRHKSIETGALVQTETQWYWIAVSLGQVMVGQQKIMIVSQQAPVTVLMHGKQAGDHFILNAKQIKILKVL